jgi:RNA-directed DNA polymerase
LIDKVYRRKNLEIAWTRVKVNRGSGGVDGLSIADFVQMGSPAALQILAIARYCCGLRLHAIPSSPPKFVIDCAPLLSWRRPQGFFWSLDHSKLLALIGRRIADGRVLELIKAMLKAGSYGEGRLFPSVRGTPQGGAASPLLSNILLTPFD